MALIAIPVLLSLIYVATNWGMADVYSRSSINTIEKFLNGKTTLTNEQWGELKKNLSVAIDYDPENSKLYEFLGFSSEGPFTTYSSGNNVAMEARRSAYHQYKQSISLRPTWPYLWARLAVVKFRMNEIDEEFFHAMHRSDEFGPWEPSIQKTIISLGLFNWGLYNNEERQFILDVIAKSLNYIERGHSLNILNLTKSYGLLSEVCATHAKIDYVNEFCHENSR